MRFLLLASVCLLGTMQVITHFVGVAVPLFNQVSVW